MTPQPQYRIVRSDTVEAAPGFRVKRAMPVRGFRGVDPFLLLDHFGPVELQPNDAGVGVHPHRGFVAMTYMIQGSMHHRDTIGNDILVRAGDINWMSAAYGLQHAEQPVLNGDSGSTIEGIQLWVNLPAKHKLEPPEIQHIASERLPHLSGEGWSLGVIAGVYGDAVSPLRTRTPVQILHLRLESGAEWMWEHEHGHGCCCYIIGGNVGYGDAGEEIRGGELLAIPSELNTTTLRNSSAQSASVLCLSGVAIGEPVFAHGPFVMNTFEEIQQAIRDYESGEMGFLS